MGFVGSEWANLFGSAVFSSCWEGHSQRGVRWDPLKYKVQGRDPSCLDLRVLLFKNEKFWHFQ